MLIQLFLIGFASSDWKKSLLPHSSTTTHHRFQDPKLGFAEAEEMLGIGQQQRRSAPPPPVSRAHAQTADALKQAIMLSPKVLHARPAESSIADVVRRVADLESRLDKGVDTPAQAAAQIDFFMKWYVEEGLLDQKTVAILSRLTKDERVIRGRAEIEKKEADAALQGERRSSDTSTQPAAGRSPNSSDNSGGNDQKKEEGSSKTGLRTQTLAAATEGYTVAISPEQSQQRDQLSEEDQIRQEWAEAIKDLKLNKEDLDDDALEKELLITNIDYHCQLGKLFGSSRQPEKAKREYQKAVLAYWAVEDRKKKILKKSGHKEAFPFPQFWEIYEDTVEKCREKQEQYFVPAYYSFAGACDGLIAARYRMKLGDYREAASFLQFFEEHGPDWGKIDPSEYSKKCKKVGIKDSSAHAAYYNRILQELRENPEAKKAYEALKAQNRREIWTLGVGPMIGMGVLCAGMFFMMNYFFPKDPGATDTSALSNPFGGIVDNVTESFSPGSNFSEFLADVIANATVSFSAQQQNISAPDATSTTLAPFVFSSTLAPAVQGCTDLAKCMLSNATFVAFLNQYLLDPSCGSAPAQFLHNLTCALIGKYYQYTQAVNMMCVLVKLQEANWVGVCAPTLSEDSVSIQDGSACLEPGPIAPVRYSSVNLGIHRSGGKRLSGSCVTKRQANPFVPTETRELTESDALTDTLSEELSPDESASFSGTEDDSATAGSGTRDDSASLSQSKRSGTRDDSATRSNSLPPPPSLSTSRSLTPSLPLPLCCTADTTFCTIPSGWGCCPRPSCYPSPWSTPGCFSACNANGTWAADLTGKPRPKANRCACPSPAPDPTPPPTTTTQLAKRRSNTSEHTRSPSRSLTDSVPVPPWPIGNCTFLAEYLAENALARGFLGGTACNTTILSILNTPIGIAAATALTPALPQFAHAQQFTFANNNLGTAGIMAIAPAFQYLSGLENLDLNTNNLGDMGVRFLSTFLWKLNKLTRLNLCRSNQIGDPGAIALADALPYLVQLQWLSICENNLNDAGAMAVANACKKLPYLRALWLNLNNISSSTQTVLREMLPNVTDFRL